MSVDLKQPFDFLLFGFDDFLEAVDFICVKILEVPLTGQVVVPLLLKLCLVECCELLDSLVVFNVVFFQLDSHLALFASESVQIIFVLFSSLLKPSTNLINFILSLFKLITESLEFGLMQVLQLLLILSVCPDEVIFGILVFSFDHANLVFLLIFHFLDLVSQERNL